jgi:hypothetical protein
VFGWAKDQLDGTRNGTPNVHQPHSEFTAIQQAINILHTPLSLLQCCYRLCDMNTSQMQNVELQDLSRDVEQQDNTHRLTNGSANGGIHVSAILIWLSVLLNISTGFS